MASASSSQETNPPAQSGSTSLRAPSSPGKSRQTRIRFPTEPESPSSKASGPSSLSGIGLRSLETSSAHPQAYSISGSSHDDFFERRRVRSAIASDAPRPTGSYARTQFLAGLNRTNSTSRRTVSYSRENQGRSQSRGTTSIGSSPLSGAVLLPTDEDNMDQGDDPNILADLRKALQYKPNVEQHLKEAKPLTDFPLSSRPLASDASSASTSPNPFSANAIFPRSEPVTPVKAEFIDFSPSVGTSSRHPIPTSTDDGATLDWSGSMSEEDKRERRWTMSLSRKSSKEKQPALSRKALVEKQDSVYSNKLATIREKASNQTKSKADITRDQLQRRYAAFNASSTSDGKALNLADAARWFDKQESVVKFRIIKSEPMLWLRHLLHRRTNNGATQQLPTSWNLSAMMIDAYLQSSSGAEFSLPPTVSGSDGISDPGSSVSAARARQTIPRPTSFQSLDDVVVRKKSDDLISFEPIVNSRPDSVGTDSRISVDTQLKRWRQSLINRTDPEASSDSSMKDKGRPRSVEREGIRMSPPTMGSRTPLHNLGIKKRSNPVSFNSDEGQSSAADSVADRRKTVRESENKVKKKSSQEKRRGRFQLSLDLKSSQPSLDHSKRTPEPLTISELRTDATQPSKTQSLPVGKETDTATPGDVTDHFLTPNNNLGSPIVLNSVRNHDQRKTQRLSLPPTLQTRKARRVKSDARSETHNHALLAEHIRKKETLDALVARNQRMKTLLQTASRSISDYDETQAIMAEKLGIGYTRLPAHVLEALKHDPAASTGHLRNLRGWRAVEDIHNLRERQKGILQSFIASLPGSVSPLSLPPGGIYESAVANMTKLVERLHHQRSVVLSHVEQTHELLSKVKKMRDELKPEFDEASRYTSVNYPELVRLESLLDELVNETNRLWKIAEASLSFLLTSVAPLMKTFGRPIWDELHDFLVIPLYRNGFSGEDHWYPVTFPRRSVSRWFRLLLFSVCAPLCLFNGIHAFVALLTHGYVLRIPAVVPTSVIYLLFSGVMCIYASLLSGLFVTVLCEMFIILWWTLWLLHIVR